MKSRFIKTISFGIALCMMIPQIANAQIDMGQSTEEVNQTPQPVENIQPLVPENPQAAQSVDNIVEDAATVEAAQPDQVLNTAAPVLSEVEAKVQATGKAALLPQGISSVVFTYWEYTALLDAKKARQSSGVQRGVTDDELNRAMQNNTPDVEKPVPPPEERELSLGGIVYTNNADWTIWLNGQRITPDALPEEIIDLKVTKHYIDVKWLDDYTQKLYPIRLRAHQRFNLDARIFLPG